MHHGGHSYLGAAPWRALEFIHEHRRPQGLRICLVWAPTSIAL